MTEDRTTFGNTSVAGTRPAAKTKQAKSAKLSNDAVLADFASFHEGYVRHYVALADTKAGLVFSLAIAFVAFLFSKPAFLKLLLKPTCTWQSWTAGLCVALIISGASLAAWVISPRLKSTGEGLVFFGAVGKHPDSDAYVNAVRAAGVERLIEARLVHCYDVSAICWHKYRLLTAAFWLSVCGLVASLPLLGSI